MPSHDLLGSHPCLVTNDWESLLPSLVGVTYGESIISESHM